MMIATIVHWHKTPTELNFDYEWIGWYRDIGNLLKNCLIDGKSFREIIMTDETKIIGKD